MREDDLLSHQLNMNATGSSGMLGESFKAYQEKFKSSSLKIKNVTAVGQTTTIQMSDQMMERIQQSEIKKKRLTEYNAEQARLEQERQKRKAQRLDSDDMSRDDGL